MFGFSKKPSEEKQSWTARLKSGLTRTREAIGGLFSRGKIDDALYDELETALLSADCGVEATNHLLASLRTRVRKEGATEAEALKRMLKEELLKLVLAAGDTFRAAAREQLTIWGERNGIPVVAQQSGDPSAVIYDAVSAAIARKIDIVLADTAGRLPTQLHLMEEIRKVKRVIAKVIPEAPHEVVLVLDANTGQNTLNQVKAFDDAVGLTGLVLTKLDGTAKGGVVAAIAHTRSKDARTRPVPLYFIGVGEGIDDLRPFNARDFVEALVD
ncbi:MAG: signaling recognition particle receptor family protein [Proteobacteria bacterium]|nr:signaling recognition particle receptor family protein [Pseudomonadota bacterium]